MLSLLSVVIAVGLGQIVVSLYIMYLLFHVCGFCHIHALDQIGNGSSSVAQGIFGGVVAANC